MAKKIIKEITIMLLLCLAIILVLGVLLYEYVPSSKIIPEEVSYTTAENIKEELSKGENVEDEQIILTYSIDATDLNNYERINTYVPGKTNPFSSYESNTSSEQSGDNNSSSGSTSTGSSSNTNNTNTNSDTNSSGSGYFPDTGDRKSVV